MSKHTGHGDGALSWKGSMWQAKDAAKENSVESCRGYKKFGVRLLE